MTWFRLHTDIIDDPKMRSLTMCQFRQFVLMLCVAAEINDLGRFRQHDHKAIAWRMRERAGDIRKLIDKLIELNIMTNENGYLEFVNWQKRQYSESYKRVTSYRQKKRDSNASCNANVTAYTDTDTDTDTEKKEKKKKALRDSDESLVSLGGWFNEIMWPVVPKKVRKDPTWKEVEKLKPDSDTRSRIVEYFKSYPSLAATYPPGEFFPPMQDPDRVIKNKRYLDVLEAYQEQRPEMNGSMPRRKMVYITQESYDAAKARGETNIELRLPEGRNV